MVAEYTRTSTLQIDVWSLLDTNRKSNIGALDMSLSDPERSNTRSVSSFLRLVTGYVNLLWDNKDNFIFGS